MSDRLRVQDLLRDIDNKELILPEFQRGYVWSRKQVKEYLHSIYKGYPTGTFLIWKTPMEQKSRGTRGNEDSRYYQLILDGQQRLTSLYALFNGTPPPFYEGENLFFDLYFNLDTEEFVYFMEKRMSDKPEWIGVTDFLKIGDVGVFINKTASDELKQYYNHNLSKLIKLNEIRNYTYDIQKISELDIDEVVSIFNLVNSSGTPLSKADLGLAHICSYWPEARDTFKAAQDKYKKFNFDLELDLITTCIAAVAVDSVLFERSFYEAGESLVKKSWEKVDRILEYLINILRNDAFIESSEDLKSKYAILPIIYYLSHNDFTFKNDEEKNKALYWMFQALMWGRYSGQTPQKLQADLVVLKNHNNFSNLIENLRRWRGGNLEVNAGDLVLEGTRSRFYPLVYVAAKSRGAKDWFNGIPLYSKNIGIHYKLENHHIFPKSILYANGFDPNNRFDVRKVNEIANIAFLTKESNLKISNSDPLKYLEEIENKYSGALTTQFVPKEKYLWDISRYDDFLHKRRELITAEINGFLEKLIKDKELLKVPTIDEVIKNGENEMVEFKIALRWSISKGEVDKEIEFNIMRTLAAFMNFNGGYLLLGVSDEGEIHGLQDDFMSLGKANEDGFSLHFNNLIMSYLGKEFVKYAHLEFLELEGKKIAKIWIEPSRFPVFIKTNGIKAFYTRTGNSSQMLDVEDTTKYINSHWDL